MKNIGLYGGTFDPIHKGHINTSIAVQNHMHYSSYRFLPCKIPTLKAPAHATTSQRIKMLEIALQSYPQFEIDLREIKRKTPSYMVDTLISLREEEPNATISLILGYDAFRSLPQWYQWEKILTLANILVINRDKKNVPKNNQELHLINTPVSLQPKESQKNNKNRQSNDFFYHFIKSRQVYNKEIFMQQKAGAIYEFDAGFYPISSTQIRQLIAQSHGELSMALKSIEDLIPCEVLAYIKQQELYR